MLFGLTIICALILLMGVILFVYSSLMIRKNHNCPIPRMGRYGQFAIVIPARNESAVIEGLLKSIQNQTISVSMEDVYIIIEEAQDPTVLIANMYGAQVIYRTTKRPRKGYALDEGFQQILKRGRLYELFFIFDADNILAPNFIESLLETYQRGYDIGMGYRNCKNGNDNVIAACSSLTFTMINTLSNSHRRCYHASMTVSGTGFFIAASWIEKWKGYPFHSLTEDYELSLYALEHRITMDYNPQAVFYDEQPTRYQQTKVQRIRWIRGYFDARREYIPRIRKTKKKTDANYGSKVSECIGVKAYILLVIGIILGLLLQLVPFFFQAKAIKESMVVFLFLILFVYLALVGITAILLNTEKDKLNLNKRMQLKTLLVNPLYLVTYIPCALTAILKKEVTWVPIEHQVTQVIESQE